MIVCLDSRVVVRRLGNNALLNVVTSTHGLGKGLMGPPLGRLAGSNLLHHLINLLQRQSLGLGNEEVAVDKGACAETTPDEEDGGLEVTAVLTDHVGGNDSDDGVPEPVGGGGETDTTGSDGEREDLADDDPGTRAPGGSEEEDEDGDEGDLGVDGRNVVGDLGIGIVGVRVGLVEADCNTDDGDKELADKHAKGTGNEDSSSTEALNSPEGEGSRADVDKGEDERNEEGVVNGTGRLEEGSRVVEDEVDTGPGERSAGVSRRWDRIVDLPLLHHLQRSTKDGSAQVRLGLEKRALEAVGPGTEPRSVGDESTLVLLVGDDLGDLTLDILGVAGLATDARESTDSVFDSALLDKVSGGVGEENKTTTEDDSPGELDTDGDAVRGRAVNIAAAVDDAGGKEETDCDAELVTRDEGTADLARALRTRLLVHVEAVNRR